MFKSHPGRLLSEHQKDVLSRAEEMLNCLCRNDEDEWPDSVKTAAVCHDFGKYLTFFQDYLVGKKDPGDIKNHSLVGALFSSFVFLHLDKSPQINLNSNFRCLMVYLIVLRHHGHLASIDSLLGFCSAKEYFNKNRKLEDQIVDLRNNCRAIAEDMKKYAPQFSFFVEGFLTDYINHIKYLLKQYGQFNRWARRCSESNIEHCLKLQMGFSLLIDADKHSAAGNQSIERKEVSHTCVQKYRNQIFGGSGSCSAPIDEKRNLIKDIVVRRIRDLNVSHNYFTFTAPTGTGKTLTALEAALILRERLSQREEETVPRRIIYVLPFTSIIDQNYKVIKQVICDKKLDHGLVLKHHHLSEVKFQSEGIREEISVDQQLMYVESWESEIIVTTYVQLIDTMLGIKNRQLKKLHNLAGAIVILDEVQNLPFKYWFLTEQLFKAYSEQFDNKWILLTATQPKIFAQSETIELLEEPGSPNCSFFEDPSMHRTEITLKYHDYLNLEEWLSEANVYVEKNASVLMVLNTINTSVKVYKYFRDLRPPGTVFYLSANMIPYHRRKTIQEVKRRLEQKLPVILISTQVVEAGVDLDFHCVIRDIGPMDSVIQVAGRCNRHNLRECGEVIILPLHDQEKPKPDSALYGIDALIAKDTLQEFSNNFFGVIPETAYQKVVDKYYAELTNKKENDESLERLNQMTKLDFDSLATFSLIGKQQKKWPVFIEFNKYAGVAWSFYVDKVRNQKDLMSKKENYLRCKSLLQEFTVQVEEKYLSKVEWEHGYCFIRNEWISTGQYYSSETGWIRDKQEEGTMIY